jgi:hypothetical protein
LDPRIRTGGMGEQLYVYVEVAVGGFGTWNSTAVYNCRVAIANEGINYMFLILPNHGSIWLILTKLRFASVGELGDENRPSS